MYISKQLTKNKFFEFQTMLASWKEFHISIALHVNTQSDHPGLNISFDLWNFWCSFDIYDIRHEKDF